MRYFGNKPVMMTAEQMRERVRPSLATIIEHHVASGASKLEAYTRAGSRIGRSKQWVQRIMGRSPDAHVFAHDWFNITALCERIEAATERNNNEAAWLRGETHAIFETSESDLGVAEIGIQGQSGTTGAVIR